MADESNLEIPLMGQATLNLAVVPATGYTLESSTAQLQQVKNPLPLSGKTTNIENGDTPCTIDITVKPTGQHKELRTRPHEANRTGVMHVSGGAFDIKVPGTGSGGGAGPVIVDVIDDQILGEGSMIVRIDPAIPHSNHGVDAQVTIPFDNRVLFVSSASPPGAPLRMGTLVTLTPTVVTGVFERYPLRLTIEEYDASPESSGSPKAGAEIESSKDLKVDLVWQRGDRAPKSWRLGCRDSGSEESPSRVSLLYPEPNEVAPYEFAWRVSLQLPDGTARDLKQPPTVFAQAVPKPKLTGFRLQIVPPESLDFRNRAEAYEIAARVKFEEFAPDIGFPVLIALWRAVTDGQKTTLERIPVGYRHFVYETSRADGMTIDLGSMRDVRGLFAVLGFPDQAGGMGSSGTPRGGRIPISAVIECGDLPGLVEECDGEIGSFANPLLANAVCSIEAKTLRPRTSLLDLEPVKKVTWDGNETLKVQLQRLLDGQRKAAPKIQCADVAPSIEKALIALGFAIVKKGDPTTETPWGRRANKAFGKFLLERGFRGLLIDERPGLVEDPKAIMVFAKEPDQVTDPELAALPIVPVYGRGFEALLSALAEAQP